MTIMRADLRRAAAVVTGVVLCEFESSRSDRTRQGRMREIARAKQVFCVLARRQGWSWGFIARGMGNIDHTTAIHHHKVGMKLMVTNAHFASLVEKAAAMAEKRSTIRESEEELHLARALEQREERDRRMAEKLEIAEEMQADEPRVRKLAPRDYISAGMPRSWWERNNDRFAEAMRRAHPDEHYPSLSMRAVPGTVEAVA